MGALLRSRLEIMAGAASVRRTRWRPNDRHVACSAVTGIVIATGKVVKGAVHFQRCRVEGHGCFFEHAVRYRAFFGSKEKTGDFASILDVVGFVGGEQFSLGTEEGAIWTGFVLNVVSAFVRRNFVEGYFGVRKLVSQKVSVIGEVFGFPAADETVIDISRLKCFGIEGKCNRLPFHGRSVCVSVHMVSSVGN